MCLQLSPLCNNSTPIHSPLLPDEGFVYGCLFVDSNPDLRYMPPDDFDPYDGRHGDYAPMMAPNMESHPEFDQSNLSEYCLGVEQPNPVKWSANCRMVSYPVRWSANL